MTISAMALLIIIAAIIVTAIVLLTFVLIDLQDIKQDLKYIIATLGEDDKDERR